MKNIFTLLFFSLISIMCTAQSQRSLGVQLGQSAVIGDVASQYFHGVSAEIYFKNSLYKFINYESSLSLSKNVGFGGLDITVCNTNICMTPDITQTYENTNVILFQNISASIEIIPGKFTLEPKIGIGLGTYHTQHDWIENDTSILSDIDGFQKAGIFRVNDQQFHLSYTAGVRLHYQISDLFKVGVSHEYIFSDNDYLDGVRFWSDNDTKFHSDIIQSTRVSVEYRLGGL